MLLQIKKAFYTSLFIIPFIFVVAVFCSSIGSAEYRDDEPQLPPEESYVLLPVEVVDFDDEPQLPLEDLEPQLPEEVTTATLPEEPYTLQTSEEAIIVLTKMVYGEARGCSKVQQAACVWCALNRVDSRLFANDIVKVVTQKFQFDGYVKSNPVKDEHREIVEDVLMRWEREKLGDENVGRVLPPQYLWFHGDGKLNYFRDAYLYPYNTWDWSLPNPYEN